MEYPNFSTGSSQKAGKEKGITFLVTTHIMSLVEEIADELMFLLEGEVYFRGTYGEMLWAEKEESLERAIANILEKEHDKDSKTNGTSDTVKRPNIYGHP